MSNTPRGTMAPRRGEGCVKELGVRTKGKRINLTRRCVNPNDVKHLTDLGAVAEELDLPNRQLGSEYGDNLSGGLRSAILVGMAPPELNEFLTAKVEDA